MQYSAVQCSTVQCSSVEYSAVEYNAVPRLGPESSLMGERRHKDEVDSADDSDGGRADQEEVNGRVVQCSAVQCSVVQFSVD